MSHILLEVYKLKKFFEIASHGFFRKKSSLKAVDEVSFVVKKGETVGLVGESGCGKSTVAKMVINIMKPSDGLIMYNIPAHIRSELKSLYEVKASGSIPNEDVLKYAQLRKEHDLSTFKRKNMLERRRKVQMIFQDPYASLNPRMNVAQILSEPFEIHGISSPKERKDICAGLIREVGLTEDDMNRYPNEFSGGQRQRICIARALALRPEFIIADEPVSALDVSVQAQVINLMQELQERHDLTYLFISHDLSVVEHICTRVMVMYLGEIMEIAHTDELYSDPLHPYTKALMSAVPVPSVRSKRNRIILRGDVPSPIEKPTGCPFHTRCSMFEKGLCDVKKPELIKKKEEHFVACHKI